MKIINKAIEVLKNGGVILYPTDTIWGIGCDATNEKAVEKIYQIKERDESKALITLVGSCNQLLDYTKIKSKEAKKSSPTTIIYPNVSGLAKNLLANDKSAAIRIVQNEFCKKLILKFCVYYNYRLLETLPAMARSLIPALMNQNKSESHN